MREIAIEANLSLSVVHLKYKEKNLESPQTKAQHLLQEFEQQVVVHLAQRHNLDGLAEFLSILDWQPDIKVQYECIRADFAKFKERKPEPMDIFIQKFNSSSLKTIYKKYLAYLRFLVYSRTKNMSTYQERFNEHASVISNESHLKEVFSLYVTNFDEHNEIFKSMVMDQGNGVYFREFKKAYYQLVFERQWADEMLEMENHHIQCLALILEFGPKIKNEQWMSDNPIEYRKLEYGCELDLPSELTLIMTVATREQLKQRYINKFMTEAITNY